MAREGSEIGDAYVFDPKTGKLKKNTKRKRRQSASEHIRQGKSKRVRVVRRGTNT
jgi:hypothetical protein